MEYRSLGRTGLEVSALGFGCGNVGGLIIRGTPGERERAVARALELGINYFDTAPSYGDGQSERHLGQALKALRASPFVGTKFHLDAADATDVPGAIARSLEASLRRLELPRVDLLQLHTRLARERRAGHVGADDLVEQVLPALQRLRQDGKIRFVGITALGEPEALGQAIGTGLLDTAQVCYNLLNPSAGVEPPPGFPAQDFGRLLSRARDRGVGVIVIRALAAGALSGVTARHPVAAPAVAPIASGPDYGADVERARTLEALVREGHAGSLIEAALRFAVAPDSVSTVLVGISSLEQLEAAAAAVEGGPLPPAALARLADLWQEIARAAASAR